MKKETLKNLFRTMLESKHNKETEEESNKIFDRFNLRFDDRQAFDNLLFEAWIAINYPLELNVSRINNLLLAIYHNHEHDITSYMPERDKYVDFNFGYGVHKV